MNRGLKYGLPSICGDIGCYNDECDQLNAEVVLHITSVEWAVDDRQERWFTPATIQRSAFRARYSTPPISSNWSLVRKWKVELGPTRALNERYGACFDPGVFSWPGVKDVVTGIVTVLVIFLLRPGKTWVKREPMMDQGIGNPPISRFILLSWRCIVGWLGWMCPLASMCTDGGASDGRRSRSSSESDWSLVMVDPAKCPRRLGVGANSTVLCTRGNGFG